MATKSKTPKGKPGPVVPTRYQAALGTDEPLAVMSATPDIFQKLLKGYSEEQLSAHPEPGKWSVKEVLSHLADGEVVLGSRYRFIAAHDRPPIPGYDQDAFVAMLGVENATAVELLDDFSMARAVNLGLLLRLPEAAFNRVGLHSERGEESIRALVILMAGHDRVHIEQVKRLLALLPRTRKAAPKKKAVKKTAPQKAAPKKKVAKKASKR